MVESTFMSGFSFISENGSINIFYRDCHDPDLTVFVIFPTLWNNSFLALAPLKSPTFKKIPTSFNSRIYSEQFRLTSHLVLFFAPSTLYRL